MYALQKFGAELEVPKLARAFFFLVGVILQIFWEEKYIYRPFTKTLPIEASPLPHPTVLLYRALTVPPKNCITAEDFLCLFSG